ncbi:MAG: hypothetical protein H6811_06140 [Phycisphaeraceae bacterium]|nr:hypothetical protein [Phycisphaeraceae bacterium]
MARTDKATACLAICCLVGLMAGCVEQKRTSRYRSVLGEGKQSAMEPIKGRPLPKGKWLESTRSGVSLRPAVSPLDRPDRR